MSDPAARSHRTHAVSELDALILCGGAGTRLRPALPDRPKSLAPVGERPFLELQLAWLSALGLERFVLCAGHGAGAIEAELERFAPFGRVELSCEPTPLGTGGAVRHALGRVRSTPFLVANGDSVCRLDLAAMLRRHHARRAALTLAVARVAEGTDFGTLELGADDRIASFREKADAAAAGFASAGVYLFERAFFAARAPAGAFSLERDLFPTCAEGDAFGFPVEGEFLDIGTPERYRGAADWLARRGLLSARADRR